MVGFNVEANHPKTLLNVILRTIIVRCVYIYMYMRKSLEIFLENCEKLAATRN